MQICALIRVELSLLCAPRLLERSSHLDMMTDGIRTTRCVSGASRHLQATYDMHDCDTSCSYACMDDDVMFLPRDAMLVRYMLLCVCLSI